MKCQCGNDIAPGGDGDNGLCEWCLEIELAEREQTVPHTWQQGRITGVVTCEKCGLMPVDPADVYSDCPGHR